LVVTINGLLRVDRKRAFTLAIRTIADLNLPRRILIKWSQDSTAFPAVELDILELWKYPAPPCNDTGHSHEVVEVDATQITQRRTQREVRNAYVYLGVDTLVGRIVHENSLECDFIEDGEHSNWGVGEEIREDWFGHGQV
jgi:hypothetical protein